jgi:hypothetical protein
MNFHPEIRIDHHSYVEIWLNPRTELKTAMKNIKTVTLGGYICTIFGWSLGGVFTVAYKGNYRVYRTI